MIRFFVGGLIGATFGFAGGYVVSRAIEAKGYGVPMNVTFRHLLTPVRLLATGTPRVLPPNSIPSGLPPVTALEVQQNPQQREGHNRF